MKKLTIFHLLTSSTFLHEWFHAKVLRNIGGGDKVFIVLGVHNEDRGKRLIETNLLENEAYQCCTFDGFAVYKRKDKMNMGFGRADVDDRSVLDKELVKKALISPLVFGTIISTVSLIIFILTFFYVTLVSLNFLFLSIISTYFFILGILCAIGFFGGTNSDYMRWRNPALYTEH
ncbi:hypothetical protein V7654_18965 [Bacillus sp. JJ1609]|uniref:hypothetical protein n=1 Tax=Bacillus sp. JJ1609 TaxID=3122977 RepID=UPI002FFE6333